MKKKLVVSVYGYGRFGKLWAEILASDFQIKVFSRRGLKRSEVRSDIEITDGLDIFNCDAIFFCVAISALEKLLIAFKNYFQKDTVFFDTCSVKVFPVKWMQKYLPKGSEIIATHPMFGPDSYGKTNSKLPLVMFNVSAKSQTYKFWQKYFSQKLMRIEEMTPREHDREVAYSQGVTHYIGRVLADLKLKPGRINTMGYNKLLEIVQQTCNDDWQLFLDLQKFNPYTPGMRKALQKSLTKISSLFK